LVSEQPLDTPFEVISSKHSQDASDQVSVPVEEGSGGHRLAKPQFLQIVDGCAHPCWTLTLVATA